MKLSPTMQAAIAIAQASGGELVRQPGGFWTAPHATKRERGSPWGEPDVDYARPLTVDSLIRRDVFEVVKRMRRGDPYRIRVKLTPEHMEDQDQ